MKICAETLDNELRNPDINFRICNKVFVSSLLRYEVVTPMLCKQLEMFKV